MKKKIRRKLITLRLSEEMLWVLEEIAKKNGKDYS